MSSKFSDLPGAESCPDMATFVRLRWLPSVRAGKYSWRVDERISRQHILPFFGPMKLNAIDQTHIAEWLETFDSRNFAASTLDRIAYVLKDIFKAAEGAGFIAPGRSPARGIHYSDEKRGSLIELDEAAVEGLLAKLMESDKTEARAIAMLALTGASKNEILSARWENYFPEKKLLVVESPSGKKRRLWLDERARKILDDAARTKNSPWIFPGRDRAKPVSQIFPFWNQIRKDCGLEGARLRDLRYAGLGRPAETGDCAGEASRDPFQTPIAIIGMGMRFPGDVGNADEMWDLLSSGGRAIARVTDDRWPVDELTHPSRSEPGRSVSFSAAILSNIDQFDPSFFGISPREASWMDPQQRILLEIAHEAMEDAGIPREKLAGGKCGVFVGISGMDYGQRALEDLASMTAHSMTGNTLSIAANRLSYFYDLRGPSLAIDTACSSGLAALHQACQAIRNGDVPMALAGGVNLLMHPYSFIGFSRASMLSANGTCRPFDAAGDGYVRGEGAALFLLKPLDQARRDGDPIRAVILGSGVNSDGSRKSGLTIPSAEAQTELMRDTLYRSGLQANDIDFVEAHGTGTPVGDPVEAASIGAAYGKRRESPLPISSAKANFGHLEPASGMVGMVRAILTMERGKIPPMPIDFVPNPSIDFKGLNLICAADGYEFPASRKLKGAVNSFGFGGLNAHILLGAGEKPEKKSPRRPSFPPLFISAACDQALKDLARAHLKRLENTRDEDYYDYAWSCAFRRSAMEKTLALWADSRDELIAELKSWLNDEPGGKTVVERSGGESGGVAFVFSGNGAQWLGMGKTLYEESPEFVSILDSLDEKTRPVLGYSVREKLLGATKEDLADTTISQPLLFVMQVAVVALLKRAGIVPDATMGHSVGEIAAAWASGALSLDQAIAVIHARSQSQSGTRGMGGMAAAGVSGREAKELIDELGLADSLEVAAANSPANATLSGDSDALDRMARELKKRNIYFKRLDLDYAFHSRQMDKARPELDRMLSDLSPAGGDDAIFVSSVTGGVLDPSLLDRNYWQRNMRDQVNFARGVETLAGLGMRIFVEIGPHAVLQRYMRETLGKDLGARVLPTLQKSASGATRLRNVALSVHILSNRKNLAALFPAKGNLVPLPLYPWQRQRCWYPRTSESRVEPRRIAPLLGWRLADSAFVWENVLDPRRETWLGDHRVGEATIFPAAAYMELALEAARQWLGRDLVALENIDILRPLIFEENRAQTVRCAVNPDDGSLRVSSRPRLAEGEWTEHLRCRIVAGNANINNNISFPADGEIIEGSKLYEAASSLGLDYGPFFRRISKLRADGNAAECELEPRANESFILDPGVLDACFHSIIALCREGRSAYLPVGAKKLEICSAGRIDRIRARVLKISGRSLRADFELFSGENIAARALDCRFRSMPASDADKAAAERWITEYFLAPSRDSLAADADDPPVKPDASSAPSGDEASLRLWYREILPRLEATALAGLASLFRDGAAPGDSAYFSWARELLKREGILAADGALPDDLPDWKDLWAETWRLSPRFLPALLPLARVLENLPKVARGEMTQAEALELVRKDAIADEKNWPGPESLAADEAIARLALRAAAKNPDKRIDILELGQSSLAERLLSEASPDKYSLARVAETRLPQRVADQIKTEFANFRQTFADPADWITSRPDAGDEQFDIVILRDALHKSKNLLAALKNTSRLLKPGGMAILAENYADWRADLIDGLDESWWQINADGIPVSSRMPPEAWQELFRQTGYENPVARVDEAADGLRVGAFLVTAKKPREEKARILKRQVWSIVGDDEDFNRALRAELLKLGQEIADGDSGENVIAAFAPSREALVRLTALATRLAEDKSRKLWIATRGAAFLPENESAPRPGAAAIVGLGRVMQNEFPGLSPRLVDASLDLAPAEAAVLVAEELVRGGDEDEVALNRNVRRVPRIVPAKRETARALRCKLDIRQPGRLDNLAWTELGEFELGDNDVEVRVMAAGLNFRDIMFSMGLLPEDALESGFAGAALGLELSGVVTRVGRGTTKFKPGDRVAGFASSCFASHAAAPDHSLALIHDELDFAAAAAVPTIFITAWYALKYLARVRPGETVLVHGGAGGVGLAAIQILKKLGARILVTAGTPEKRDFLRMLGADGVLDSRSLDFADEITELYGGVDVVLNSLAGEAMRRSAALLKPFGRFLELGKRDYVENTSLGLRPFKENISYFSIDVDQLLAAKPDLAIELFEEVMTFLRDGTFIPPPYRIFPASQAKEAFRAMQQAKHMGKIVIDMSALPSLPAKREENVDYSGAWIVSGGTSGFGLATARRLVKNGVREIILASRRGGEAPEADAVRAEFAAMGAKTNFESCDFSDANAVKGLVDRYRDAPLRGVVHAAAVFNDKYLKDMTAEDFEVSLRPKLLGAINLHEAVRDLPLKYFVVFSSVSVALGNPGQGNYVAANAGLEGLVHERLKLGLPATAIAWGPVSDVGYLARNSTVGKSLASFLGREPFSSEAALDQFDESLGRDGTFIVANANWKTASRLFPREPGRLAFAARLSEDDDRAASGSTLREELESLPQEEALERICRVIVAETARVLEIDGTLIDPGRGLQSLGLDSLMAMELALSLEQKTGLRLPPMLLQDGPSARQLASRMARRLRDEEDETSDDLLSELARRHSEDIAPEKAREILADMEAGQK